jgi:hypothetical protein
VRPSRATTAKESAAPHLVIPTEVIMGLRPTQGDENRRETRSSLHQQSNIREAPPYDLSSRPKRSAVEGPAVRLSLQQLQRVPH